MIIVTGGAGFIGSNIVKTLNDRGRNDILVVDDLSDGHKFINIADCDISDYLDKDEFLARVNSGQSWGQVDAIFHEGACSTTTEWDGRFMMENNFEYSKHLLHYCLRHKIPYYYASSAAVYGGSDTFKEEAAFEKPLNVYGYSKLLFDNYLRKLPITEQTIPVAGFRYFNVYGPREQHKGSMSSVAYHFNEQIKKDSVCRLFAGHEGYADGEQQRDFVFVDDVVAVNLWAMEKGLSGIYNLGTGACQRFNDVANAVIDWHKNGKKSYIPFPDHLKGAYQSYTQADMSKLRSAGYQDAFHTVEQGVAKYLDRINPENRDHEQ